MASDKHNNTARVRISRALCLYTAGPNQAGDWFWYTIVVRCRYQADTNAPYSCTRKLKIAGKEQRGHDALERTGLVRRAAH